MDGAQTDTSRPLVEGREQTTDQSTWRSWLGELWRGFPAWLYYLIAISLIQAAYSHLSPPRPDLATAAFMPLCIFAVFLFYRQRQPGFALPRRKSTIVAVVALLVVPVLTVLTARPSPLSTPALLRVYEISTLGTIPFLLWHMWRDGLRTVALFFVVGLAYGTVLENGGIMLGYFHEPSFVLYLPGCVAPLATMMGWVQVIYMSWFILHVWREGGLDVTLRRLSGGSRIKLALVHGLLFGGIGTGLDLLLDPIATHLGAWHWHPSLPADMLNVPVLNFVAWMCALTPFGFAMSWFERPTTDPAPNIALLWPKERIRAIGLSVPLILVAASALFWSTMLLLEGGTQGPTVAILEETFGRLLG
jgi:hypothetical protein